MGTVRSTVPIDPAALDAEIAKADSLLKASPLYSGDEKRPIFLTNGGWRWTWLSISASGSFALTRLLTANIVTNKYNPQTQTISNGRRIGGKRKLSSILAHEFTHELIRERYGFSSIGFSNMLVEGYCDHVAQDSSLSDAQVAELEVSGKTHPALFYYHGRKKVVKILAENDGSVDALFLQDHNE